jgi:ATP-binding cassette, subfamily B (MDR/TAP), member 1
MKLQQGFSDVSEVVDSNAGGIVSECIVNTKTIFCYNMQDKVVDLYNKEIHNGEKTISKTSFINGIIYGLSQFFMFVTYSALFLAGGFFMYQGTLEMKNMFRAIFVLILAGFGLGHSQQYVGDIAKSKSAIVSIFTTIDEKSLIDPMEIKNKNDPPAIRPNNLKGKIEFRNVYFSYPSKPGKTVLHDVSFTILPGQKVGFVGYSGSGKSTIVQLIERFYDVDKGSILIDDVDIKNYDLITLRSYVSMVMQEPVLFNRTNSENVRYGKLDATREEIEIAAKKANISDLITPERDRNIPSGGQKQKLAIARAIIKNPSILLLDEATSALDSKSEVEVQKTLDSIMDGRTTITIAHKLATVVDSDIIFLMEKGTIKETGTHNELMQLKGKYSILYNFGNTALTKL